MRQSSSVIRRSTLRSSSDPQRIGFRSSQVPQGSTEGRGPVAGAASSFGLALEDAQMRLEEVRLHNEQGLKSRQDAVRASNEPVEAELREAKGLRGREVDQAAEAAAQAKQAKEEAHNVAADRMGAARAPYYPAKPDPEDAYRPRRITREDAISRLGMRDGHVPHPIWEGLVMALIGIPLGVFFSYSMGVKWTLLDPDLMTNLEPERLGVTLAVLAAGIALVFAFGAASSWLGRNAAEQHNTRGWTKATYAAMALAALGLLTIVAVETWVNYSGLVAMAEAMSFGEEKISHWVYVLVGMATCLPWTIYKLHSGIQHGLKTSCDKRSQQHADTLYAQEMEARRSDPLCQEAAAAVSRAMNADRAAAEAEARLEAAVLKQKEEIAGLSSRLSPIPTALTMGEELARKEAELRVAAAMADHEDGQRSFRGDALRRQADAIARRRGEA